MSASSFARLSEYLTAQEKRHPEGFSSLTVGQQEGAQQLRQWVQSRLQKQLPLRITIICTGNSRRSMLGAVLGNVWAHYFQYDDCRFFSGGTHPSAFHANARQTLQEAGVRIELFDFQASSQTRPDNQPATLESNPTWAVLWDEGPLTWLPDQHPAYGTIEFSKQYQHPVNPSTDFAAVLVCDEAASDCPIVMGAAARIPLPIVDPKYADNTTEQSAAYDRCRDQLAQAMFYALKPGN